MPGTIVALRYQIIELLGVGGMARVYRARHRSLNIEVALKIMAPQHDNWTDKQENWQRFEREARNAARLNHPNCVRVLDYGACADGSRYLAMDLVDGPTLRQEMRSTGRFTAARAIHTAVELLRALGHAHRRSMLHRDIKPENIMFTHTERGPHLMLIDFGLSRLHNDAALTATGSCVGSPSYLAPERLLSNEYDGRADLYSVGVLLYEMLAGTRPFVADSVLEIAKMQILSEPVALSEHRNDLPHELVAVVHKALAKKPAQRFANAECMLVALSQAARAAERTQTTTAPFGLIRQLARGSAEQHVATLSLSTDASSTIHGMIAPRPVVNPRVDKTTAPHMFPTPTPDLGDATTDKTTCLHITVLRSPPLLRRVWAWLRFGSWRRGELNSASD